MRSSHTRLIIALIAITASRLSSAVVPFSVDPSQYWEGNDGPWNSFDVRVGSPQQVLRLFPSTAAQTLWVVLPEGCPTSSLPNCNSTGGGSGTRGCIFSPDQSVTWLRGGYYELGIEENLGYTDYNNGEYGYDRLSFGWPTLERQVIVGIATSQWYLGVLGLNPQSINVSDSEDPKPSVLSSLRAAGHIPSLSYGYTAGAYRQNLTGSLTLGGYDASRFVANGVHFKLTNDTARDLVVAIQSVSVVTATGTHSALDKPILAYVDSTVPHIWLPLQACEVFEAVFGITWDPTTDLYLVNDTVHQALLSQNPNVTFLLDNSLTERQTVAITLPYSSFDLSVSWPIIQNTTASVAYFPLRRAANTSQVTLGRAFLQEAYLTVDYERGNFSVSQAAFNQSSAQQLVAIEALNGTSNNTINGTTPGVGDKDHTPGLPPGAIAGIVVGVILLGAFALFLFIRRWRTKQDKRRDKESAELMALQKLPFYEANPQNNGEVAEIGGEQVLAEAHGNPIHEAHDDTVIHEDTTMYKDTMIHEDGVIHELPGDDLSSRHNQHR